MLQRIRKILALMGFATTSPGRFAEAAREAYDLLLDRRFSDRCCLPSLSAAVMQRFETNCITLPSVNALVDGTQDVRGLAFLVSLGRYLGADSVFEIGTFTGITAMTIAKNCPKTTVHTLDLPSHAQPSLGIDRADAKYVTTPRVRVYEGTPEAARIVQHHGDSARFDYDGLRRHFDIVYVDGAHSYDYVANDTRAALSIVSPRGAIVWDDYQRAWPGVVRYLNEQADLKLYRVPDTRLVVWFADPRTLS